MFEVEGKYNKAKVFASTVENECISQIMDLCNQEWLTGCQIAIMPDTHAGKGCTIGTTIQLKNKVCPSLVGVDLGCGMLVIEIPQELSLDLPAIDNFVNNHIPSGFNVNESILYKPHEFKIENLKCFNHLKGIEYLKKSIGSLGGGNHFIEINEDSDGKHYLVIHTGSRNLGKQVAEYYQDIADECCNQQQKKFQEERKQLIQKLKLEDRQREIQDKLKDFDGNYHSQKKIPHDLCYLEGENAQDYLYDAKLCAVFASLNRKYIAHKIMEFILENNGLKDSTCWIDEYQHHLFEFGYENAKKDIRTYGFETIHNYIGDDNILRKGAISAHEGEKVIIPINMRDGSIIGTGKGNKEYNFSGPHGAGRLMSRSAAKEMVDLKDFEETMKGIYSSSVCQSTIDESPMAYKSIDEIVNNIEDSVKLIDVIKPIYNFKAH